VSWIHARDAVRAILFAIDDERMDGPFNVTAPEPVTMNDLAHAIGEALGRPSFLRVPPFAIKLAVGEGFAEVVLTGQRAIPKRLEQAGFRFDFPDLRSALRDLLA
jgi:NAD dependent epimerase/dehydratase family enzyme